ncbi:MAG: hypothetical protein HY821_24495 [Acidobacteria bacterium]|nr:hypothetical protein [Acidobacteriota bacterium]
MTTLVLVGGFLGAGKTTLILESARRLSAEGKRVGVVMNDQAGDLVDTRLSRVAEVDAGEVTGGCFCCRFSDLTEAIGPMLSVQRDVIFAEPVGSCADLVATVLAPLDRWYGDRYRLAPYSVVVDPQRAKAVLAPGQDERIAYLFRKQLEEADLVVKTKSDLGVDGWDWNGCPVTKVSAMTGEGVDEWLELVLGQTWARARPSLEIDYSRYAEAEASLAWLNWRAELNCPKAVTPACVAGPLLEAMDRMLTQAGIAIAHMKVFVQSRLGYVKASVCANGQEPIVQGPPQVRGARAHEIVLNLRATAAPEQVKAILSVAAAELPGRVTVRAMECFRPTAPQPQHRLAGL